MIDLLNSRFWPVTFSVEVELWLNCSDRFDAVELTRLRP